MHTERELLERAYGAFNSRNIDAALAAMHPDVDWANGMDGGRVHGHDAVRAYWTRQWTIIDPRVEIVGVEPLRDGRIAARVHQVVRDRSGNVLSDGFVRHVYTIRDGLVARMDIEAA